MNISHLSLKFYDKIYFSTNINKNVRRFKYSFLVARIEKKYTSSNINFIFLFSLFIYIYFQNSSLSFKNDHYSLERNSFLLQLLHSKETIHNKLSNGINGETIHQTRPLDIRDPRRIKCQYKNLFLFSSLIDTPVLRININSYSWSRSWKIFILKSTTRRRIKKKTCNI